MLGTPENCGRDARVGIGPRLWSCRATDASVNRTNRGWSGATRRAWSTEHLTNPRVRAEINEGGRGLSTARLNRHAILEGHAFTRKMRWKIYGEGRRYADIVWAANGDGSIESYYSAGCSLDIVRGFRWTTNWLISRRGEILMLKGSVFRVLSEYRILLQRLIFVNRFREQVTNWLISNVKVGEILKRNVFGILSERRSNRITTLDIFWILFEVRFRE